MFPSSEYVKVLAGGCCRWDESGVTVTLHDETTKFFVPRNEVLMLRNFCNSYMKQYGAVDNYGRAVIDPASEND